MPRRRAWDIIPPVQIRPQKISKKARKRQPSLHLLFLLVIVGAVVVIFFGDAAVEEGAMYESANFAALHNLPIIFVCENNRLAIDTPLDERSPTLTLHNRFESIGVQTRVAHATDVIDLLEKTEGIYKHVRSNKLPVFFEINVNRWASHVGPNYIGPVDLWLTDPYSSAANNCPLARTIRVLLDKSIMTQGDIKKYYSKMKSDIETTFEKATHQTHKTSEKMMYDFVYSSGLLSKLPHKMLTKTRQVMSQDEHNALNMANPF